MRALVLEDSNFSAALSIVRALGRLGHDVVVAAPQETPAGCSRWCGKHVLMPSPADPARYLEAVLSLLRECDCDIGFACDDPVVEILSRARAALPPRPDFMLPPPGSFEIVRSKLATQRFASSLGVPTPRTVAFDSVESLQAAALELGFPCVMKDDQGFGGGHVRYLANGDDLLHAGAQFRAMRFKGRPMAQEFVPGGPDDVYMTQVLYHQGELVAVCSHRKLRQFPLRGGTTARGVTVHEPALDDQVTRIFSALCWHGPAKADSKRDARDGSFRLLELDGRVGASFEIAAGAGLDFIDLCCRMVADGRVQPALHYAPGTRRRMLVYDLLCLAARPSLLPAFLLDSVNPSVRSDFDWQDLPGSGALLRRWMWIFDDALRGGRLTAARPGAAPGKPGLGHRLHRSLLGLASGGLRAPRGLYHAAKLITHRGAKGGQPQPERHTASPGPAG